MTEPITRRDPRLAAWSTFLRAHAKVVHALETELQAEQDLALTDYDVLVQLAAADDRRLRMSDLADRLLLSRSGATRLVDRLVADGLVERVVCDSDRRGQWAS
ncbi:MAG TPA: helix-turn-helix domain-containing protein, partial [Candidatus Limnocylindria bacterium]|nr:helix-turn-helix domain-containing protein [Candidatus Limnocylindria bacterium]